jgi:sigma-B regulation protein RsbU (phosphoserine phosphatase)
MRLIFLELESTLRERKLWPQSWVAWAALYVLGLDLLLFAVQWLTRRVSPATSASLTGWVTFLSVLAIVLLATAGYRWLRSQLLWRLRNRLIVTYVFIGVIPVFLLFMISLITLYLLAGQFASFVVTSDIATHLRRVESWMRKSWAESGRAERSGRGGRCAHGMGTSRSLTARGLRARLTLGLRRLSLGISATLCATTANSIFGQQPYSRLSPNLCA